MLATFQFRIYRVHLLCTHIPTHPHTHTHTHTHAHKIHTQTYIYLFIYIYILGVTEQPFKFSGFVRDQEVGSFRQRMYSRKRVLHNEIVVIIAAGRRSLLRWPLFKNFHFVFTNVFRLYFLCAVFQ